MSSLQNVSRAGARPASYRDQVRCSVLFVALLLPAAGAAHAQPTAKAGARSGFAPVVVSLVDRLPGVRVGDVALIRRAPGGADSIFLPAAHADGESLTSAAYVLLASRQLMGAELDRPTSVRVPERRYPAAWAQKEVARATKVIRRAQVESLRALPGWGGARVVSMKLTNRKVLSHLRKRP